MKALLIEKIIRLNQEKLQLLIKSNMISIKIKERMTAKNYKSIIKLIDEKARLFSETEQLDHDIVKEVKSLGTYGELTHLSKLCNEEEKEKLALLKESSFKVLKQMESNKLYDEGLVREIFEVIEDKRYLDLFLK